jgi:SAM-dependent MidA family methyltransferase
MKKANENYYNSKSNIYQDFLTYTQKKNNLLGKATALNFYSIYKNTNLNRPIKILEIGVGNGNFAFSFLDQLYLLDKNFLSNIEYNLADFSSPILNVAYLNLKKFFKKCKIKKLFLDANNLKNSKILGDFDYIRSNELLSDLQAKVFCLKNKKIYEVLYDENLNFKLSLNKSKLNSLHHKAISFFKEEFFIPINIKAKSFLNAICKNLSKTKFSYAEFFDYGFFSLNDFILEKEDWNKLIVRKYSSQITVDVNFYYLFLYLNSKNFFARVFSQKDYVQKFFSKVSLIENSKGLDYSPIPSDFEEEDYFYCLSINKK